MTNATAVRIAPNNMVVPIPSDVMLSGIKYRVDRLLLAVLVPHQRFIAQFRIPKAIIPLDYFHAMPELEEIEAPGVDVACAAWIIDLFNRSGRKAIAPVRRNPGANRCTEHDRLGDERNSGAVCAGRVDRRSAIGRGSSDCCHRPPVRDKITH
jgi:hypothetical protein